MDRALRSRPPTRLRRVGFRSSCPHHSPRPDDVSEASRSVASTRHRASRPIPRTLTAIAEIAAALATGESVGAVMPGILGAVASELDGAQATLWLRGLDGLRRAWSVANDDTPASVVEAHLQSGPRSVSDGCVVAPLLTG